MNDNADRSLISRFDLDDAKLNAVQRKLAREHSAYVVSAVLLFLALAFLLINDAAGSWVASFANGTDDFGPVALSAFAAVVLYFLWVNARGFGTLLAHVWRPDRTICKGQVDGVTMGPCLVRLTDEAISWENRDHAYALHLAGVSRAKHHGGMLLLKNNVAETRFAFGPDMGGWVQHIKDRRRELELAGWALPHGEGWRPYTLPRADYQAGLSEVEVKATPPGALKATVFSVVMLLVIVLVSLTGLVSDTGSGVNVAPITLLVPACLMVARELRWLIAGVPRHRKGMSAYGRDVADVTHGQSAFRIGEDGIEIARPLLRRTVRWNAIASVEQNGGWLSLRAADITLDVVPSSSEMVEALGKIGFTVPCGPWASSGGAQRWTKAA